MSLEVKKFKPNNNWYFSGWTVANKVSASFLEVEIDQVKCG